MGLMQHAATCCISHMLHHGRDGNITKLPADNCYQAIHIIFMFLFIVMCNFISIEVIIFIMIIIIIIIIINSVTIFYNFFLIRSCLVAAAPVPIRIVACQWRDGYGGDQV